MHAVVNHIDGQGVSVVHTRNTQEEANDLGLEIAIEQGYDGPDTKREGEEYDAFVAEVKQTLAEHGTYTGSGWDITVIEVSTTHEAPLLDEPISLRLALKRAKDNELVTLLAIGMEDLGGSIEDLNNLVDDRIAKDASFTLTDLRYRVVGHVPGVTGGHFVSGQIIVEVRGEIDGTGEPTQDDIPDKPGDTHCVVDTDDDKVMVKGDHDTMVAWAKNHNGKVEGQGGEPCYVVEPNI